MVNSNCTIRIVWDDSVVYVFEFTDTGGTRRNGAFVHVQVSQATGSQTQVTATLQTIAQIQVATDPGTWIETLKNAARNNATVNMWFEDTVFTTWQPPATVAANFSAFNISAVYSIAG